MNLDLSVFLKDMATTATLSVGGTAQVIFDNAYAGAFNGMVAGTDPSCTGRTSDLAAVTVGSTATINGNTYAIVAIDPDGTGMTKLQLREA